MNHEPSNIRFISMLNITLFSKTPRITFTTTQQALYLCVDMLEEYVQLISKQFVLDEAGAVEFDLYHHLCIWYH